MIFLLFCQYFNLLKINIYLLIHRNYSFFSMSPLTQPLLHVRCLRVIAFLTTQLKNKFSLLCKCIQTIQHLFASLNQSKFCCRFFNISSINIILQELNFKNKEFVNKTSIKDGTKLEKNGYYNRR